MAELAEAAGVSASCFTRVFRLSFLAPDITGAILRDQHPVELTAHRFITEIRLPLDWDEQRRLLGFR